ncbi:hypothetical protein QTH91_01060 [Variovorax dokdonensis]|uniref:Uncharacterized protein n=1 Tax=Variovorax dokdonensis TaxID=344883 RepID=A0ABT7N542_9BURK|nr:hypothetical protein [Variovorax dokdonensis]MDM0043059.1 hypothetical protein [Variovorax dokdonensis]
MSTFTRFDFGLNAAIGLSAQMAATWSPWLPREPRLLVPVHLDVLVVRSEGKTDWAETALTPGDLQAPPPFTARSSPRGKGAYLLWAPPDALARGRKPHDDEEGPIEFPPLPERWLVLRISPSRLASGRRTVRGWVLKADEEGAAPVSLEQYVDAIEPEDGAASGPAVTAVGPGQLDWIGYFDNVQNRFGFHDPLTDVASGPVAYLVCGWYRDPDRDPLCDPDIRTQAQFEKLLQDFRWHLPDHLFKEAQARAQKQSQALDAIGLPISQSVKNAYRKATLGAQPTETVTRVQSKALRKVKIAPDAWWPRHSLYHGAVVGIGWPGRALDERGAPLLGGSATGEEVGGPPSAKDVKVGFGTTLTDAMSAMIARRDGNMQRARVLQAFQLGAMNELDEPDGRARLDALMHATTFTSLLGGSVTERVWQPPLGEPPAEPVPKTAGPGVFERYYRRDEKGTRGAGGKALLGKDGQRSMSAAVKARGGSQPTDERKFFSVKGAAGTTTSAKKSLGAGAAAASPPSQFKATAYAGKELMAQVAVEQGRLVQVANRLGVGPQATPYRPGRWVDRERPLPRFYRPMDPQLVIEGIKRSYQHGGDGRFSRDGWLGCRLSGAPVKDFRFKPTGRTVQAEDLLDRSIANGSVPPECEDLLGELALLDPGSSLPIAGVANPVKTRASAAVQRGLADTVQVQQTAWWAMRDPRTDSAAMLSLAPFSGTLPSPVAINLPSRPWNPLHLEWRVDYIASPRPIDDWSLGEIDYDEDVPDLPDPAAVTPLVLEGRTPLSAGVGRTMAGAIRRALADAGAGRADAGAAINVQAVQAGGTMGFLKFSQKISQLVMTASAGGASSIDAQDRATLDDIASALEQSDLLSASLDGLHTKLRGGFVGDGAAAPGDGSVPPDFVALRSGFLRIRRLRVVDAFGQVLDLAGSGPASDPDAVTKSLGRSESLEVTTRAQWLALAPRLTSPARLWLRFMDARGGPDEAHDKTDVDEEITPVCGYLMPNHLDDALLFYGTDGRDLGVVRRSEDNRIVWEDAPGAPSTVGASPSQAIANPFAAGMAQGLLDWGVSDAGLLDGEQDTDTALRALMRVIDTTRWTVDPFGHQGEEHLALLVGQPVVVVRAVLRLEVDEPVDPTKVEGMAFQMRLGALTQWQDGLLGYFVDDDYRTLHCSQASVAELARAFGQNRGFLQAVEAVPQYADGFGDDAAIDPITHPYVDRSGVITVRPNRDIRLTLLLEPHTLVHATCGVLPRKEVGLRREWTQDALARLSPTFRFGPVLVDPKKVRMPVAVDLHGTWSWDHRTDVTTWENLPVQHATHDALFPQDPPVGSEGWLRLTPLDPDAPPPDGGAEGG